METTFEAIIKVYLKQRYGKQAQRLYEDSYILQYITYKTQSADKGSKSRASFANLYAIYVIIEDYIINGFNVSGNYSTYEGAKYSNLLKRQRELPFGAKLQNHALNSRMNEEFFKFFPMKKGVSPIMRNLKTQRYWFNENYLIIKIGNKKINIAQDILNIIDKYISVKQDNFKKFIIQCEQLQRMDGKGEAEVSQFILSLLEPNVDARLFEIVSYSILKSYYKEEHIYWGYSENKLKKECLSLYKTGRTNANDGGIDFVMKPLGRFFQVTETLDFKKYFLDIEKIEHYPITFVVKSEEDARTLLDKIQKDATKTYIVKKVIDDYLSCIEELINIPKLRTLLKGLERNGQMSKILKEIILQSKVEFNYDEDEMY